MTAWLLFPLTFGVLTHDPLLGLYKAWFAVSASLGIFAAVVCLTVYVFNGSNPK
jgi:hypothetical protein